MSHTPPSGDEPLMSGKGTGGLSSILAEDFDVWQAVGGVRGMCETTAPSLIFILTYTVTGALVPSVVAPLVVAALAIVVRIAQRIDVIPALGGVAGVVVSAVWAWRSGEASNFFGLGLLTNVAYLAVLLLSILVRWPALGLFIGFMRGDATGWRTDPRQAQTRRRYTQITWLWVGLFAARLLVQAPLFFAQATTALGVARMLMGPLLFALVAWFSWMMVRNLPQIPVATTSDPATTSDQSGMSGSPAGSERGERD